jgi:lactate dehydrogenase-like 2-hydroxyacid dehydrogenase
MKSDMKPVILVNCQINEKCCKVLNEKFSLHFRKGDEDCGALSQQVASSIRGMITKGPRIIDSKFLGSLPNLEIICNMSAGFGAIDVDTAKARNIIVTNGSGTNAPSVADHAMGLLLAVARRIVQNNHVMCSNMANEKMKSGRLKTNTISGKTLGRLGLGSIGIEVVFLPFLAIARSRVMPLLPTSRKEYKRESASGALSFLSL